MRNILYTLISIMFFTSTTFASEQKTKDIVNFEILEKEVDLVQNYELDEIVVSETISGYTPLDEYDNLKISVDVKYVYSYKNSKAIEIISIGEPTMCITDMYEVKVEDDKIVGGKYNKKVTKDKIEISRILFLDKDVQAKTKTYNLNITLSDL